MPGPSDYRALLDRAAATGELPDRAELEQFTADVDINGRSLADRLYASVELVATARRDGNPEKARRYAAVLADAWSVNLLSNSPN
jgi:hypothetical protein